MNWEGIGTIVALLGLAGTVAGLLFSLGKRDARLEALEKAFEKEQAKNSEQHKDFYAVSDTVIAISTRFEEFGRRLGNIEDDVKEILRRMPKEG
jgi:hypothetical protein